MADENKDILTDNESKQILHQTIDLLKSMHNALRWNIKARDKVLNPNSENSSDETASMVDALDDELKYQSDKAQELYKKLTGS